MPAGWDPFTSETERDEIRSYAEEACSRIDPRDLAALGYDDWLFALERGIAAHHAGLVPLFKEVVETLFQRGLVWMVFATETPALGINMPARSVVLEKLVKWNGESHVDLTPGEYTQLTGRAGRRGIDIEGHAVVVWHSGLIPVSWPASPALAPTRCDPVSGRRTTWRSTSWPPQAGTGPRHCWSSLFAQYQADASIVNLAAEVRRNDEALAGYREAMECHLGDFAEYRAPRRSCVVWSVTGNGRPGRCVANAPRTRRGSYGPATSSGWRGDVARGPQSWSRR
ncbi:MAG: hypothetical protein U0R64_10485 [Candidatus Nanopelagicales bacterium]